MAEKMKQHAFISYLRDNQQEVDLLCNELTRHGVNIWLDRNEIKVGSRWKDAIRDAIRDGSFFIACFSKEYSQREKAYMNEELALAIDELRLYPSNRIWFIPVLLSECDVPTRSIGGGETLLNIQWVPLYENWDANIKRIVEVIKPIPPEIQSLIHSFHGSNIKVRLNAVEELGESNNRIVVPTLIEALKDEDDDIRRAAVKSLAKIGDEKAVQPLIERLKDGCDEVCVNAAIALAVLCDPESISDLINALTHRNLWVRLEVVRALDRFLNRGVIIPALIKALRADIPKTRETGDIDSRYRTEIVIQLGSRRDKSAVPALLETLEEELKRPVETWHSDDGPPALRIFVIEALGEIGDRAAVPMLINALEYNDGYYSGTERTAARVLGLLGDESAIPALQKASLDRDRFRDDADEALKKIKQQ